MNIFRNIIETQKFSSEIRGQGKSVAVVPTMGFLHEGHLSLIDIAKEQADAVIVTIFVNPTQFAPNEDLDKYPRDFERDLKLCEERLEGRESAIFAPETSEMYPENSSTWVIEEKLSQHLCGESRPTHFRGVTTVVAKLFNATLPDVAVFGQKDAQQALIIKRMVRDLNFPIEIIIAPIVREADGLAMSSRNKYLSPDQRNQALSINQSLRKAKTMIESDECREIEKIATAIKLRISQEGGEIDYVSILDATNLESLSEIKGEALIAVAVRFGNTRLIDNVVVRPRPKSLSASEKIFQTPSQTVE